MGGAAVSVRVQNNILIDAQGRQVVLRGVNLSGTEYACAQRGGPGSRGWSIYADQPLDASATYAAIRAWHANVVRVPLNEDCWLGINGVSPMYGGTTYMTAIRTEVALIHQAGMMVILDLHWSAPGAYAAVGQQPMPDADHSIGFWSSVAAAFRDDPGVLFDVFNEPYGDGGFRGDATSDQQGWSCWRDGCAMQSFVSNGQVGPDGATLGSTTRYAWRSAGMQQLIDAVRGSGARQPVIVAGIGWANDISGWLAGGLRDPAGQLIAGIHLYPAQGCQLPDCWGDMAPVAARVPVVIGETGDSAGGPVTYLDKALPSADQHGLSYLAWTWNPWDHPDDVLITGWDGKPTPGEGSYYRDHLASVAGSGS